MKERLIISLSHALHCRYLDIRQKLNSLNMLFYLFAAFQILYSVSCSISCYNTISDANIFQYIVTADQFPTELHSSSLKNNSINCLIQIIWQRNPHNTRIVLVAEGNIKAASSNHKLDIEVGYENEGQISIWEQALLYQCNTDQCNSLSQLKLLLSSLTMNDKLIDLVYLLSPIQPFQGEWCYRGSNATFQKCDTTIPNNLCIQCELTGIMNQTRTEVCATCAAENPTSNYILAYGKTFYMADRTYSATWLITCGRESCNTPTNGDKIREKSYIDFDFNKFLNNETAILSMNKMALFFIMFFMKLFQ
jgi:hypothetical protein